ncbi:TNF receptor-associated factor 5 [Savitreella phatthalungensis]
MTSVAGKIPPADVEIDYDALVYPEAVAQSLHCPICKNVLLQPLETACHHVFCSRCVRRALADKRECPVDRISLPNGERDLTPCSRLVHQLIDELEVICPSAGCTKELPRGLLRYHLAHECPHFLVACPDTACTKTITRQELLAGGACPHTPVACDHCGNMIEEGYRIQHLDECSELSHQCAYCADELSADDIRVHRQLCEYAPVDCKASAMGCDWHGLRGDALDHDRACVLVKMLPYLEKQRKTQDLLRLQGLVMRDYLYSTADRRGGEGLIHPRSSMAEITPDDVPELDSVLEISTEYSRDRQYLFSTLEHQAAALDHLHNIVATSEQQTRAQLQQDSARHRDEMQYVRGAIHTLRGQLHAVVHQLHHAQMGSRPGSFGAGVPFAGLMPGMPPPLPTPFAARPGHVTPPHSHQQPPPTQQHFRTDDLVDPLADISAQPTNPTAAAHAAANPTSSLLGAQRDLHESVREAVAAATGLGARPEGMPMSTRRSTASALSGRTTGQSSVSSTPPPLSPRLRGANSRSLSDASSSRQHVKL